MAGNVQGDLTGNIFVETDYNNIILIDPNKIRDINGAITERLVDHENLVMFANLEAQVLPRTKLALGIQPNDNVSTTMTIAKINFLRPNKSNYLSSGYLDEITGNNSLVGRGQNQMQEQIKKDSQNKAFFQNGLVDQQNVFDNGLLGITSINVRTSSSFIPSVSMQLEDVQGRALFQLGDQSPYSAFFNLPYPQFYLTLKGYYGQAIRYQLNLEKFDARFNTSTGNYSVSLEFRGFKFNILNEILISHLIATPHMYNKRFSVTSEQAVVNNSTNSASLQKKESGAQSGKVNTSPETNVSRVTDYVTERGYEKIVEVYSEYKAKKLLPPDFPELTLMQFVYKMDMFEQNVVNSYPKANVEPLTNIKNYQNNLLSYFNDIRGERGSWFSIYMDNRPLILKNKERVYFFRQAVRENLQTKEFALQELDTKTQTGNKSLLENPTLGFNRKDEIKLGPLGKTSIILENFNPDNIDLTATTKAFYSVIEPTTEQLSKTKAEIELILKPSKVTINNVEQTVPQTVFQFDGVDRFDNLIRKIEAEAAKKLSIIQEAISQDLALFIEDSATGIGFKPTVRNIVGVIMANAEAFIRLLDEVHTNAWNVKSNPTRRVTIQNNNTSARNPEAINTAAITNQAAFQNQGLVNAEEPVYPWPLFFVETPDDKKGRFQLTYLGDPSVVQKTQAFDYKTWPEVEFVEEYLKGLNQKDNPPYVQPPISTDKSTFLYQYNAIEFPPNSLPYTNKQIIKFMYEIWERQYVSSFYSNLIRVTDNQRNQLITLNTEAESENILQSLGQSNPNLSFTIKNEPLTAQTYPEFLKTISSNGTGPLYQQFIRGFFTTPYIIEETENPFKIFKLNQLGFQPQTNVESSPNLKQIVSTATNTPIIVDTYPFTVPTWVKDNMSLSNRAEGNQVYSTQNVLTVFPDRNMISNFENIYDYTVKRPVTTFCYLDVTQPTLVNVRPGTENQELVDFYNNQKPNNFIPTVGYISNLNAKNLPKIQTTSLLNSPYFINAIQKGVQSEKSGDTYPYAKAAYLFLNSLPLANLRQRYRTYNQREQLDYIASCFNKFGALHKLPYAWILKIGSIWYRYKNFIDNGVDILDDVWKDFNYVYNYDPTSSSKTKVYEIDMILGEPKKKIVLENIDTNSIQINTGFYPQTINDFSYFYNGVDLFKFFTNSEIQSAYNSGMKMYEFPNSKIVNAKEQNKNLNLTTWSVLIPKTLNNAHSQPNTCVPPTQNATTETDYFIIPSFGINLNQTKSQCFSNPQNTTAQVTSEPIYDNKSVFNGSVRAIWSAPNYGYFDSSVIAKPRYDQYITTIIPNENEPSPFALEPTQVYSSIEEIFAVFDKKSLNLMEQEFLNYSRAASNVKFEISTTEIGVNLVELNASLRNFQLFLRSSMNVSTTSTSDATLFQNSIEKQFDNFRNNIKSLMEYDMIIKNGNPSNYSRRIFGSYLQSPNTQSPITFKPYVPNSLPTQGGTTTLAQSQQTYPIEWETLQIEVGFSTISGLVYSDNGSYITDFFVDNNIEFSSRNIVLLSKVIKMYATQKQSKPSLTATEFKTNLSSFLSSETTLQNELLNQVITSTKKQIEITSQPLDQTIKTQISGGQGKAELYSLFKAVNDKWISGTDYSTKTLFEDILFLDRASRNIGETIIVDIFAVKNLINSNALNENMSVYTLISGLLMQNNFTVMPLPAYVNFYNVQTVDGVTAPSQESIDAFGNNLWGTFTNVDYRNSLPKMVCFYVGKPSEQLALPRQVSGYGDDGFDLRNPVGSPLIENQDNKTDWALSNKCVGFTVDIGIRNQNVFQNFSVSQDSGKATSESIAAFLTMADQKNTRTVATQNASLYNLYKRRSYQCDVTCLGNALLQPTMYFNLRHIPMFNGPYLITEVNHVITPGDFTTSFKGVRQGIFDMPQIDSFIQKINQNLLTKIEALILQQTGKNTSTSITQVGKANDIIQGTTDLVQSSESACRANLDPQFERFLSTPGVETSISSQAFADALKSKIPNNPQLQTAIYILSYVRTFYPQEKDGAFRAFNFNLANITLDKPLPPATENAEREAYTCRQIPTLNNSNASYPILRFQTLDKFIDFMSAILSNRVSQILDGNTIEYYCTAFPSTNVSVEYYKANTEEFISRYRPQFEKALLSANAAGLVTDFRLTPTTTSGQTNNQNTTTPTLPTCPETLITSITPTDGRPGTILSMSGTNLNYVRGIEIGGNGTNIWTPINLTTVQFIDNTKIKFSVPTITSITTPTSLQIRIITAGSTQPIIYGQTFTFIP